MSIVAIPPPTRAALQPSIHARGVRGFVYHGALDDYHAPGALVTRGETKCAVDAAWLVERVLGPPQRQPHMWPGVPGARERATQFGVQAKLYRYQQEGAAFLAERDYAVLTDQMGVGKTGQALIAAEARLSLGIVPHAMIPVVLILCPALAKRHWQREVLKWTGHEAVVLDTLTPAGVPAARYVIANYDILGGAQRSDAAGVVHDVEHLPGWGGVIANGGFLIAIMDEAHLLRSRTARRTQIVKRVCRNIPVAWGLTGTPIPNYRRDLWALLDLLSNGLAGTYWTWARAYCAAHQAKYGWDDKGADRHEELRARLTFTMFGRSKEVAGLELPEKRREIYRVDVAVSAPTVAEGNAALSKSGFVAKALRKTAVAKRSAVIAQAVEALESKQKVVVFVYMREQAEAVAKGIKNAIDCHVACVHGDLTPDGRDAQATVFRETAAPACFVATIDSVGLAISLVGADLVIFGDLVPEPHKLLQAEARCHRHGSTCRVLVRYLIGTGTLDEGVAESVIAKLDTIENSLGQEAEQTELKGLLGGRTDEQIVDGLFERLKMLSGGGEE